MVMCRSTRHGTRNYTAVAPDAQQKERYTINTNNTGENNYTYVTRRIGSTTYRVKIVFCDSEQETMEDKVLRMIRNEVLENGPECGIMEAPQMSRQSERSA